MADRAKDGKKTEDGTKHVPQPHAVMAGLPGTVISAATYERITPVAELRQR